MRGDIGKVIFIFPYIGLGLAGLYIMWLVGPNPVACQVANYLCVLTGFNLFSVLLIIKLTHWWKNYDRHISGFNLATVILCSTLTVLVVAQEISFGVAYATEECSWSIGLMQLFDCVSILTLAVLAFCIFVMEDDYEPFSPLRRHLSSRVNSSAGNPPVAPVDPPVREPTPVVGDDLEQRHRNMYHPQRQESNHPVHQPEDPLDEAEIEQLPHFSYKAPNVHNDLECAICEDKFRLTVNVIMFPVCGHMFHSACIKEWLKKKGTCPIDRRSVREEIKAARKQAAEIEKIEVKVSDEDWNGGVLAY